MTNLFLFLKKVYNCNSAILNLSYGLKTPEFIQDNNFRVIIWRKNDLSSGENDLSSSENDPSSSENDLSTSENELSTRIKLNKKQILVLEYCRIIFLFQFSL